MSPSNSTSPGLFPPDTFGTLGSIVNFFPKMERYPNTAGRTASIHWSPQISAGFKQSQRFYPPHLLRLRVPSLQWIRGTIISRATLVTKALASQDRTLIIFRSTDVQPGPCIGLHIPTQLLCRPLNTQPSGTSEMVLAELQTRSQRSNPLTPHRYVHQSVATCSSVPSLWVSIQTSSGLVLPLFPTGMC